MTPSTLPTSHNSASSLGEKPMADARAACAAVGGSPGLVYLETTHTQPCEYVTLTNNDYRLHRMKTSILTASRLHTDHYSSSGFRSQVVMLTLTYRPSVEWRANHVSKFLNVIRSHLSRRKMSFSYVYVAELTKAGRVHFHVCLWLPYSFKLPKPDKAGWWPHGLTKVERVRCSPAYLAKYASKAHKQANGIAVRIFPRGLRLYAVGGLHKSVRPEYKYWRLPKWLREKLTITPSDACILKVQGGYMDLTTGEIHSTPWSVEKRAHNWSWVLLKRTRSHSNE